MTDESGNIYVDPQQLLHVTCVLADGSSEQILALVCGYTAVQRTVAMEVIFDPAIQPPIVIPSEPYYCPPDRLQRRVLPPKNVQRIAVPQRTAVIDELRANT